MTTPSHSLPGKAPSRAGSRVSDLPTSVPRRLATPPAAHRSPSGSLARKSPTTGTVPRTRTRLLRARTVISFAPESYEPGQTGLQREVPVLLDPSQLGPGIRSLMFAVGHDRVAESSPEAARKLVCALLGQAGVGDSFLVENALEHVFIGNRWVPFGGFLFPLHDAASGEVWGQVVRADDDLWMRASVAVEEL